MIYTEKELVNLHQCSIFKLDALTHLNEKMIVQIGEETDTMITTNLAADFSHGVVSPKSLRFYDRSLTELNNERENFVLERVHPETSKYLLPALIKFYQDGDDKAVFTDIQKVRRDINQPYQNIFTSSKISANGNFITFNLPISELGSVGKKMEKELEISKKYQQRLPQFITLTKKEKLILTLLTSGLTNKEISEQLMSSSHTIRTHRMKIYQKLDISSLKEAINWSIMFNLI